MSEHEPIGVIGVGWVGLVTAAGFAELGHEVYARDIVADKVDALSRGEVPIHEPGLEDLVTKNRDRLHFTTDMDEVVSNAQLLFCCVDTPPTYSGDADLSRVARVVDELGDSTEHALVMKSTVPVGTGRSIQRRKSDLGYVSCPEFLKEGAAVADFMNPNRVVVGAGPESADFADRVEKLYEPLGAPIVRTDVASAEMIKLASNAFLATKISFINEIANVSEELGADVEEVARGMGLDERIGPSFLRAGIGYGGSCLVGDETVLVRRQGRVWSWKLEELFELIAEEQGFDQDEVEIVYPDDLEILSWHEGEDTPEFLPVGAATRRAYNGEVLELQTKMGRRVTCTPDHPFVVADENGAPTRRKLASELTEFDLLPVAPTEVAALRKADAEQRGGVLVADRRRVVFEAGVVEKTSKLFHGHVYSLKVPDSQTFVTTGGLVTSNCFPKDVSALKQLAGNSGYHFQLLSSVIEVNELQKRRTIGKLQKHLGSLVDREIALLGLAFKPHTDDVREATALVLAHRLLGEGASVRVYDPVALENAGDLLSAATACRSAEKALEGADAAVLVTEWPEFRELDWAGAVKESMRTPLVVDGRNFLDDEALRAAGYTYEGIGRPSVSAVEA